MSPDNEPNLQGDIQRYLNGSIALYQLEDSLVDALLAADTQERELAGAVHVAIAGLANGLLTEVMLRQELENAIRPFLCYRKHQVPLVERAMKMIANGGSAFARSLAIMRPVGESLVPKL